MNPWDLLDVVPMIFVLMVFTNRYILGRMLRFGGKRRLDLEDQNFRPTVAVVVPLFNEGEAIFQTVKRLLEQTYDPELLRIIVVDDCSTDDSATWALRAASQSTRVTVLRNDENMGKRRSINRAVRQAEAEIIVSVDSDALLQRDAIEKLVPKFVSPEVAAVGGRVNVQNANENWLTKMQAIKYFFGYEYLKNIENVCFSVMCLSGCLTAYRRSVLLDLEPILENRNVLGVPIKYGEDRFLTRQIVKAGYLTRLTLDAVCYTTAPNTLSKLMSQQLRWRRSNIIDYVCGLSHAWKMHPLVAVHYLSLFCLLLIYPVYLLASLFTGGFFWTMTVHLGLLAIFGLIYCLEARGISEEHRVHPLSFLSLGLLMPVSYVLLTVLALFTLDSDSWETRLPVTLSAPQRPLAVHKTGSGLASARFGAAAHAAEQRASL